MDRSSFVAACADCSAAAPVGRSSRRAERRHSCERARDYGDAEDDEDFLARCGLAVALANALPFVRAITKVAVGAHGDGVVELIGELTAS